ncbi:hypothetical protein BDZ91DRAFT_763681 [Kalaharituber pfeilii]|nr:hypothetical protein BDZ91DRAFT_763681 [Kalaharituber pfeilii]
MFQHLNIEMQSDSSTSSSGSSRRHRSKSHKKTERHAYYLFRNVSETKPWARAERMELAISDEQLKRQLARSQEAGKEPATIMNQLPSTQLKHITKLQAEKNAQSSKYEWRVVSLWHDKPDPEHGNVPQAMWSILKRERKEKFSTPSSPKTEPTEEAGTPLTHEELQKVLAVRYLPATPSYIQPGGACESTVYYPAQPAIHTITSTPSIGGIHSAMPIFQPYEASPTTPLDNEPSGYSSDTESVSSNLTSGSSASSGSNTSIVTPPTHHAPLRGILRNANRGPSSEVSIQSDSPSDSSATSSEQECKALAPVVCYSGVNPNPLARSYIGTAPHAKRDYRRARRSGRLSEYELETATTTSASSVTKKTRFSDEASFCFAYDVVSGSEDESESEYIGYYKPERRYRRSYEPGALAHSKYVQYGSD